VEHHDGLAKWIVGEMVRLYTDEAAMAIAKSEPPSPNRMLLAREVHELMRTPYSDKVRAERLQSRGHKP
jgi:hypothetical protein